MERKHSVTDLGKGINLEKSGTMLPWKTGLSQLKRFGNPEIKKQSGREIVVWKDERILNGLHVNLNVICERGMLNREKKLKNVSAYLCEGDFESLKYRFESEFGVPGKFHQSSEAEFQYTWKTGSYKVILSRICRFGTYWKLDIRHSFSLSGLFNPVFFRKFRWKVRSLFIRSHFLFVPQQELSLGL
jgi:hypothetical protein